MSLVNTVATNKPASSPGSLRVELSHAVSRLLGRPARVLELQWTGNEYVLRHMEHPAASDARIAPSEMRTTRYAHVALTDLPESADLNDADMVVAVDAFDETRGVDAAAAHAWIARLTERVALILLLGDTSRESPPLFDERCFTFVRDDATIMSRRYCYLAGELVPFTRATLSSRPLPTVPYAGTRRYYRNDDVIVKLFALRDDAETENREELRREAAFLKAPPPEFGTVPRLYAHGEDRRAAWLVRERLPGRILSEAIRAEESFDAEATVRGTLAQLAVLERYGLYHNDLRPWNVLLQPDGTTTLLDYGSITSAPASDGWPAAPFPAFWLFVWCVTTRAPWYGDTHAPPFASPFNLPDPYCGWGMAHWNVAPEAWSFASLAATFDAAMRSPEPSVLDAGQQWIADSETYMQHLHATLMRLDDAMTNRLGGKLTDPF